MKMWEEFKKSMINIKFRYIIFKLNDLNALKDNTLNHNMSIDI